MEQITTLGTGQQSGIKKGWVRDGENIPRPQPQDAHDRDLLLGRQLQRQDGRDGHQRHGEVGRDVQHGLRQRHVHQTRQGPLLQRTARPAGDARQHGRVGDDGEADGAHADAVDDARVDAEEDHQDGHLCHGGRDQVGQGVGQQHLVELNQVRHVELDQVAAPAVAHHWAIAARQRRSLPGGNVDDDLHLTMVIK